VDLTFRSWQNELDKAFGNKIQQKLGDALREGAQGTNGQAFETFHRFALVVHELAFPLRMDDRIQHLSSGIETPDPIMHRRWGA